MQTYREIFKKRHTFLAVVHAENDVQALKNTRIAQENGADGVFLINHSISPSELIRIYVFVRFKCPTLWLGLNMLSLSPIHALGRIPDVEAGLWVDNAGVRESGESSEAVSFATYRARHSAWKGLYFGGVAFKYQEEVFDVAKAAAAATPYVDVVTTSGVGTGSAPDPSKIKSMKRAIGAHPLAIASGITPENIDQFLDADCFLVATGISDSHTELNPRRVAALANVLA